MVTKKQSFWLWVFAVVFTVSIAMYQKMTGPTYPVRGKIQLDGKDYKYKFLRSYDGDKAPVSLKIDDAKIEAFVKYRIYRSNDKWTEVKMVKEEGVLKAYLPHMPPAGKIEYQVYISKDGNMEKVTPKNVVLRYKGKVPLFILIPHIFFMFFAMLFSFRTGLEALFKGSRTYKYAKITVINLFIGGLILGPIVQKYAFGDYWTGWPFGGDWTDNKTIFAFLFWVIALLVLRKNRQNRLWPIIAAIVMISMYMIPHSTGGSELDPKTGKVTTGMKK